MIVGTRAPWEPVQSAGMQAVSSGEILVSMCSCGARTTTRPLVAGVPAVLRRPSDGAFPAPRKRGGRRNGGGI